MENNLMNTDISEFANATKVYKPEPQIFKDTALNAGDLLTMNITPRERLAGSWMRGGDIGFIYGERGKGKTFFSLSLACALASGTPLYKWSVEKPRRVCYVDGEMALENIQYRIRLFSECAVFKDNADTMKQNIFFQHYENIADRIEDAFINLTDSEQQERLFQYCVDNKIEVLFLDNLSCLFRGMKENDADEWEKVLFFLLKCRKNRITVVIVHHTGKNGNSMRGTSKREDAIDWAIWVKDNDDPKGRPQGDAKEMNAIISFAKNREGTCEDIDPFSFRCLTVGNDMGITFERMSIEDRIIDLIKNGINRCGELADELGISKGQMSKLATGLKAKGILSEGKNRTYNVCTAYDWDDKN